MAPDFFLDDFSPDKLEQQMKKYKLDSPGKGQKSAPASDAKSGSIASVFNSMKAFLTEEMVQKTGATYSFVLSGKQLNYSLNVDDIILWVMIL